MSENKLILSGDEAVAQAALASGVRLGVGYPGTPSTEVLETFAKIGGKAQWAPNEKVAMEVGIGVSFAGARTIVTMKHVGMNVAADPLFTLTYTGCKGGMVIVSADDPGMASSQNEQDNRNYAKFAQFPMLEPADSQEAYLFACRAFELSERFGMPVLLRMTTRVCHSQAIVHLSEPVVAGKDASFQRDVTHRVMVPAFAKKAHVRLVDTMNQLAAYNEKSKFHQRFGDGQELGIITSGVCFQHVMEACPSASILKLGMTWPLPMNAIRNFVKECKRVVVVEEGSRFLEENIKAAGIPVEGKDEIFLFSELNVDRVKKLIAHDSTPDVTPPPGRPPQLCPGCPHRKSFELLRDMNCIVAGDIGCYTLGVMPPFNAMDCCVCMGASIGVGLGLRHSLKEEDARRVVSVIGDSTFVHSGLTGLVEMVYNKPSTGHLLLILDNATTAMTGLQEHPATGRHLDLSDATRVNLEAVCKSIVGDDHVTVMDPVSNAEAYAQHLKQCLASNDANVIIVRRPCVLQMKKLAKIARKTV